MLEHGIQRLKEKFSWQNRSSFYKKSCPCYNQSLKVGAQMLLSPNKVVNVATKAASLKKTCPFHNQSSVNIEVAPATTKSVDNQLTSPLFLSPAVSPSLQTHMPGPDERTRRELSDHLSAEAKQHSRNEAIAGHYCLSLIHFRLDKLIIYHVSVESTFPSFL